MIDEAALPASYSKGLTFFGVGNSKVDANLLPMVPERFPGLRTHKAIALQPPPASWATLKPGSPLGPPMQESVNPRR